jgi:hypothetical protein
MTGKLSDGALRSTRALCLRDSDQSHTAMSKRPTKAKQPNPPPPKPEGFDTWRARAEVALEQTHGVTRGTIPTHEWTKLYVRGLSPQDAADAAERSGYNKRSQAGRLRKR